MRIGHLQRGDPRLEGFVAAARLQVLAVQRLKQVELVALGGRGQVAVADVADDLGPGRSRRC